MVLVLLVLVLLVLLLLLTLLLLLLVKLLDQQGAASEARCGKTAAEAARPAHAASQRLRYKKRSIAYNDLSLGVGSLSTPCC